MAGLALVFPGQGSQSVGMGAEMALEYESAAEVYNRASEVLGWDVADLCFGGPEEKLNLTEYAQPALYVNSMAAMAAFGERGIHAEAVCGHSLGEYSALAAAGAVGFEEGLELVAFRGAVMGRAAAARPGSMGAILGLADAEVEKICSRVGDVWPVNYNSPGQLVISGDPDSVRQAMELSAEAGAKKAVKLAVSGSFHSPFMEDAAVEMRERLTGIRFKTTEPPFLSSISCEFEDASSLTDLLVRQIVSPVRWRQAVEQLITQGVDTFFEVGNGKVLSGLIRRINRDVTAVSVSDPASLQAALDVVRS